MSALLCLVINTQYRPKLYTVMFQLSSSSSPTTSTSPPSGDPSKRTTVQWVSSTRSRISLRQSWKTTLFWPSTINEVICFWQIAILYVIFTDTIIILSLIKRHQQAPALSRSPDYGILSSVNVNIAHTPGIWSIYTETVLGKLYHMPLQRSNGSFNIFPDGYLCWLSAGSDDVYFWRIVRGYFIMFCVLFLDILTWELSRRNFLRRREIIEIMKLDNLNNLRHPTRGSYFPFLEKILFRLLVFLYFFLVSSSSFRSELT